MTQQQEMEVHLQSYKHEDLLALVETLYQDARAQIAAGSGDQNLIRACNTARRQIEECRGAT